MSNLQIGLFFEYWLVTIAALFVIVNPLTTAFVFMSMLSKASEETRARIALRSVLVATGVFLTFALLGGLIFQLFGITLEAFRIAGGIILFGIAMRMISQGRDETESTAHGSGKVDSQITDDIAIIPLAIPFMSGPGAIATVMILTSEAPSVWHVSLVFVAIGISTAACYYAMIYSQYLVRYLGETGKEIITRLFGLILSVIAVQFVINGVVDIYKDL